LNAIVDDTNAPPIGDLSYKPGAGVISSLRSTMLLVLANSEKVCQLFVVCASRTMTKAVPA
jgi:hypothetical protein